MGSEQQVTALVERADEDAFVRKLYDDPVGTLRGEGYDEFASDVEDELVRIDGLLRQIIGDEEFRQLVEEKPTETLTEWGLPEPAVEPVLAFLGAPDGVIERASAEVELHGKRTQVTAAAAAAVLGALAFAQSATAASPEGIRHGSVGAQSQIQPNPFRHGSVGEQSQAQPNPLRYGGPRAIQPNPWKYGGPEAVPAGYRWSKPEGFRYVASFLRHAR